MQVRLNALMDSFAKRAKVRREELLLTQTQVAKRSGLKQPDISKIERGDIKKTTELLGLARALECSPDWLESGMGAKLVADGQATVNGQFAPSPQQQFAERRAFPRVVSIESAVEGIANHLNALDGYNVSTVISLLTTLANEPDMHQVVAAGLKSLKPDVRGDPSKHRSPAQKAHGSRAA